jgi:hypothetical protein
VFIVLGAFALMLTLYYLWQSLRVAMGSQMDAGLGTDVVAPERAALLAEKHTLLVTLRDLENEREAGKLSQEDFSELSARYRGRAREVLRLLDEQLAPHRQGAKDLIASTRGAGQP